MTNLEFAARARDAAQSYDTVYLWGTFGSILTEKLIRKKAEQYPARYPTSRQNTLKKRIPQAPWAFDCVGLIKGILWGWEGDSEKTYGGAVYKANGVPDRGADAVARACTEKSEDFSRIAVGEAVYKDGHIGIYVGDGRVAEATLGKGYDGVVLTDLHARGWTGHGKLPWVTYEADELKKGDEVYFRGTRHYTSSASEKSYPARAGKAKITLLALDKAHPYHVVHSDGESNVHGWVNEEDLVKI